ncbi:MAG: hypothetical protein BWY88_00976 [Synergistetes bacterium ADurb.Bin520]|nr:MAG: hypothetical protein BWY88_00976 [Synergistetes bacterium ADurb.Bin520]
MLLAYEHDEAPVPEGEHPLLEFGHRAGVVEKSRPPLAKVPADGVELAPHFGEVGGGAVVEAAVVAEALQERQLVGEVPHPLGEPPQGRIGTPIFRHRRPELHGHKKEHPESQEFFSGEQGRFPGLLQKGGDGLETAVPGELAVHIPTAPIGAQHFLSLMELFHRAGGL